MDKNAFLNNFYSCFENLDQQKLTFDTDFLSLEEWDSLTALSIIAMLDSEYGHAVSAEELRSCKSVESLFNLINEM